MNEKNDISENKDLTTLLIIVFAISALANFPAPSLFGQTALQVDKLTMSVLQEVSLSGTLHLYLVTNYGDTMQEVDRYRETGEGAMIAFILKTDKKIDMSQYLDKEDVDALKDYAGTTLQSEFMIVPDWEVFESFSYKDFAAKYAHKRIRVTGTLFFPMGGWQNVTPVRMDFSKVEVVESKMPMSKQ